MEISPARTFHTLMEWKDGTSYNWQLPILWSEAFHSPLPVEDCLLQNGQMEYSLAGIFHTLIRIDRWNLLQLAASHILEMKPSMSLMGKKLKMAVA